VTVKAPPLTPWVTYTLMGVTILVYLLQLASRFVLDGVDYPAEFGLKANDAILNGELWRLLTPVLLHSTGSLLHIGFNMYALYALGPGLERHYGHARFLALYLLGGFAGNVLSFLLSPKYSLGASTAIFGLIGAEGVFLFHNRELFGRNAQRALINILTVAGINLIIGLSPGIDNWGHVGGLLGGTLFAWFGGPLLGVETGMGELKLADRREPGVSLAAAILVGLLFALLAAIKFFLQ
jgi:rhomboid protease GluP